MARAARALTGRYTASKRAARRAKGYTGLATMGASKMLRATGHARMVKHGRNVAYRPGVPVIKNDRGGSGCARHTSDLPNQVLMHAARAAACAKQLNKCTSVGRAQHARRALVRSVIQVTRAQCPHVIMLFSS